MLSRVGAWFLPVLLLLASSTGCKARESAGQDSRPLPTPEPPASPSATSPREDAATLPKKRPVDEDAKEVPAKPKRPPGEVPAPTAAVPTTSSSPSAPSAPAAGSGGSPAAPALPSAPVFTPPSAACLTRCQGAMQGCLSAPVDGGVPGFGNLDLCKKAFEACQAACK
jgi:hypothetical protein